MNNEQILKKAIEKIENKGWYCSGGEFYRDWKEWLRGDKHYSIIFSPSFAKAYWGNQKLWSNNSKLLNHKKYNDMIEYGLDYDWQYHQHKMLDEVQAGREPLKYIERFL